MSGSTATAEERGNLRGAWTAAWLLMAVNAVSWIDRTLPGILIEPIRAELHLSDTRIALLNGLSFALCYAVVAIPLSWLADRLDRVAIIIAGAGIWCALTIACGFAQGFWPLFACRMGVGLGEAAMVPAAFSLLSSLFSKAALPRALAVFALGTPVGVALSFAGGGAIHDAYKDAAPALPALSQGIAPWRLTFMTVGAAGLVAAAALLFVREPRREAASQRSSPSAALSPAGESLLVYFRRTWRFLVPLLIGVTAFNLFAGGYLGWLAPLMTRTYAWPIAKVGALSGLAVLVCGFLGAILGGWITTGVTRRMGRDAVLRVVLAACLVIAPAAVLAPLSPTGELAYAGTLVMLLALFAASTVVPAAILNASPPHLHARVTAVNVFIGGLLGGGLGPALFAIVTDAVLRDPAKLRYSLSSVSVAIFAVTILGFALADRRYPAAIAAILTRPSPAADRITS